MVPNQTGTPEGQELGLLSQNKSSQVEDLNAIRWGVRRKTESRSTWRCTAKTGCVTITSKLLQGKFNSVLGENTSTGGVELGPREGMEISFLG